MAYYQITNTSGVTHTTASLTLAAGATTILNVTTLGVDLNPAILAETLVVVKLGADGGGSGGSGDPTTSVIETNSNAALTSQIICSAQASRLPPGVIVTNNTTGDVAIRNHASSNASWTAYDTILAPGEMCTIAADYLDTVRAICETNVGTINVKVYF